MPLITSAVGQVSIPSWFAKTVLNGVELIRTKVRPYKNISVKRRFLFLEAPVGVSPTLLFS